MDWGDIAIHCAAAIIAVAVASIGGLHWFMAGAVTAFFFGREAWQFRQKYRRWGWPWNWSRQKILESAAPAGMAFIAAGIRAVVR